jgi:hypothetical protein
MLSVVQGQQRKILALLWVVTQSQLWAYADPPLLTAATGVGIEIRTSTDRTAWTKVGVVWPNGASWTDAYTGTSNG